MFAIGSALDPRVQLQAAETAIQANTAAATARLAAWNNAHAAAPSGAVQPAGTNSNSASSVVSQMMQMLNGLMQNGAGANGSASQQGGSSGSSSPSAGAGSSPGAGSAGGSGAAAAAQAKQFVGQDSQSLKGKLPNFEAAGGQTNNCADFVCSILKNQDPSLPKTNSVSELKSTLQSRGYKEVQSSQAKAGDVAFSNSGSHVQLVSEPGKTIGSNNDQPGHQVVSERPIGNETILSKG